MERFQQRTGSCLPGLAPLSGWLATDLALDRVQLADPFDSFSGNRRGVRLSEFLELAPHMRPASYFLDMPGCVELVEPVA
jgi:hypothetical protein